MNSVLIISRTKKSIAILSDLLLETNYREITAVANCGEARRLLMERDFDLHIINAPLVDEFGDSLACSIAAKDLAQVILIVKTDLVDIIAEKVENQGVFTLAKPVQHELFWNALKLAHAAQRKIARVRDENQRLLQKIEEMRIVDRAKCILIAHLSMTEAEAHRYIEKHAMDMRLTKREIAQNIIRTYSMA